MIEASSNDLFTGNGFLSRTRGPRLSPGIVAVAEVLQSGHASVPFQLHRFRHDNLIHLSALREFRTVPIGRPGTGRGDGCPFG